MASLLLGQYLILAYLWHWMKRAAVILVAFAILLQCGSRAMIVAYYQANKKFIAANLCENRAKPKMRCNGKCYLAKKIKAEEEKESKLPSLLKELSEVALFYEPITLKLKKTVSLNKITPSHTPYLFFYIPNSGHSIFQPPQSTV